MQDDDFEPIIPDDEPFDPILPDPELEPVQDGAGVDGYGPTPDMTAGARDA